MTENQIATLIVDASLKIHRMLGPGLLESVYEATLAHELRRRGLTVKTLVRSLSEMKWSSSKRF